MRLVIAFCFIFLAACSDTSNKIEHHLSGQTMGTTYNVKFIPNQASQSIDFSSLFEARLHDINKLMSTYDPTSELSRFNQNRYTDAFKISDETEIVVREALRLGQLSQGLLDVTVGPMVNLWGFGPTQRPEKVPTKNEIEQTRDYVGLDKISVSRGTLQKTHPLVYVDLSTIAKGYAVDELATILDNHGVESYLVEIGGEMRLKGAKSDESPWRIAIEKPITNERVIQKIISVGDNAIATSGDYRNYFEDQGMRYSHIIDPTTGEPIQHNTVAVTVVHPSSMTADGLATALMVMSYDKAKALAETHQLAVLIIRKENDAYVEYSSPKFNDIVDIL